MPRVIAGLAALSGAGGGGGGAPLAMLPLAPDTTARRPSRKANCAGGASASVTASAAAGAAAGAGAATLGGTAGTFALSATPGTVASLALFAGNAPARAVGGGGVNGGGIDGGGVDSGGVDSGEPVGCTWSGKIADKSAAAPLPVSTVGEAPRFNASHATGTPTTSTNEAATSPANCGRVGSERRGGTTGASTTPLSKRRMASAIAASRRAGAGGGCGGSALDALLSMSSSPVIASAMLVKRAWKCARRQARGPAPGATPVPARSPPARQRGQRRRRLRRTDHAHEFSAITKRILAACAIGYAQHVVIRHHATVSPALEQFGEGRDC